jgi:hypothetical protein
MRRLVLVGLTSLAMGASLHAQAVKPVLEAKTVELRHLTPKEAVSLLSPYVVNGYGGVYAVSDNLAIITLKDVAENIPRLEQVLAKYDHSPATIRLVFQLIEADTSLKSQAPPGGRIAADLDSALRSVLRFHSYRLLSQAVASVGENAGVDQKLAGPDAEAPLSLWTNVGAIRVVDASSKSSQSGGISGMSGSVRLQVQLYRPLIPIATPNARGGLSYSSDRDGLISTGLDVPLGQTVVLGTAATSTAGTALILTVRPELVAIKP